MPRSITPNLWFDGKAEEAAEYYCSLFPDSRIVSVLRAGEQILTVEFELLGQTYLGLNWRSRLPVHRGRLVRRQLRGPGRDRPLLGAPDRRRRRAGPLRLVQGPLRPLVAGRARRPRRAPRRGRRRAPGPVRHGQDRHRRAARGGGGGAAAPPSRAAPPPRAAFSAASSWRSTIASPRSQKPGSARSTPTICPSSSGSASRRRPAARGRRGRTRRPPPRSGRRRRARAAGRRRTRTRSRATPMKCGM